MKANELRIGNWVRKENYSPEFHKIEIEDFAILERSHNFYQPIPLTEEWLLKMGFELSGHQLGEEYSRGNFSMYYYNGDYPDYEGEILASCFNGNNVEIKYIHQLQNIYFALTGEELTIKI